MKIFLKLLTLWAFVINSAFGQGDPAPFIKGMGSTGLGNSASTIIVPNNQSTKINAYQALIETGNTNLLVNSGFEHSTPTTGWTLTNATAAVNTTNKLEGAKSLQVTPTVAGGGIKQIITLNASNLLGSQGVVEVPVRTSGTDVKVCFLANSVRTYCTDVPAFDSTAAFKTIVTPITFDGTSNGIEVYSTGTSVFIVDEIKVGRGLPFQTISGSRYLGKLKYTAALNCEWVSTATTYSNFTADTDCSTPSVTGIIKAPATKIPAVVLPAGSQAGTYYFTANGMFYRGNTSSAPVSFRFSDGTNFSHGSYHYLANTTQGTITGTIEIPSNLTVDTTYNIQVNSGNGASISIFGSTNLPLNSPDGLEIQVYYYPPESKIYSQASQDYDWTLFTPTSPNSSITFTSPNCYKKREGSDLLIRCNAIIGAGGSSGSTAQMALPDSLTTSSTLSTSSYVGTRSIGTNTASSQYIMVQPAVGYITFSTQNASANTQTLQTGASVADANQQSFLARIPIQGWSDYGVIVGSFAGIEKCANDYECTDMFSATITNGNAISNQNLPWLSTANWSPAGTLTLTFNTNLKDGTSALSSNMNCWAIPSTQGQRMSVNTVSTTQVIFENRANDGTANSTPTLAYVYCQKGTNDYKPKTAKVASSIGVPTVPGITTSGTGNLIDVFSVSYGGASMTTVCSSNPCTRYAQIGSGSGGFSSIGYSSAGNMTANFNKTYANLNCSGNCVGSATCTMQPVACTNCSSASINTQNSQTGAGINTYGTLYCIGSY